MMKTLKCDLCDHEESAETFEEWMNALKPHYGEVHAEVMQGKAGLSDEEKRKIYVSRLDSHKFQSDLRRRFESALRFNKELTHQPKSLVQNCLKFPVEV